MRGISMYDSSSVSTLFSSLGSSKSTGSGMFGINLSEYASIRSGSYGKLMRSYFSMDSTKSTSKSDDSTKNTIEDLATTTSTSKDSTKTLAAIESDAKELTDSAKALYTRSNNKVFTKDDICLAEKADIPAWMNLMRLVIDGYPVMDEADYLSKLITAINEKRALVLKDNGVLIGAMAFSSQLGCIDFLGINPQYRKQGIQKLYFYNFHFIFQNVILIRFSL